jgi:hypothetical protein
MAKQAMESVDVPLAACCRCSAGRKTLAGKPPVAHWLLMAVALGGGAARGEDAPAAGKVVHMVIDTSKDTRPISPYIYGMNAGGTPHDRPLSRLGGNRWSAYNWENNASNAGSDWHHQSDGYLSESDRPGEALRPAIEHAAEVHQALVITVPMCGYVAADKAGDGDVNRTPDYLKARFKRCVAKKEGVLSLSPETGDADVYEDEFANWVEKEGRKDPKQVFFYALDNEPDLWSETHKRIHPEKVTFAEMVKKTTEFASAIKDVNKDAIVLGFVSYGWNGYRTLQDAPDADGRDFTEYFLKSMKAAEEKGGRRLVDVLDLHWYPEARGGDVRVTETDASPAVVAARVQAPRSLWDPTYTETSWITRDTLPEPIQLIPRTMKVIRECYPGTKLSFTEYTYGAGSHISGGIAEADALGIFGREGVYAAAWWDTGTGVDYVNAALDAYLNFDGKGGRFGDTSVSATTDDIASTAVYASVDEGKPRRVVSVMINRTDHAVPAEVMLAGDVKVDGGQAYRLDGSAAAVKGAGKVKVEGDQFRCELPAFSVTTVVLTKGN